MLTIEDCIGLSGLSEPEIDAIAEHEHLPEMLAVELGAFLERSAEGQRRIAAFLRDDIEQACRHGDARHAGALAAVLCGFLAGHPGALWERNIGV
ncbi:hypothetical protein [Azospirillum sp. A39]|uniref:hypothetical protein n=1 Tax=Azospirillum sp. A39 TaxID=3462279 RepID=UPI0040467ECE